MNNDDNLDLLDLNDDADSADTLPEAAPLAAPRPKKPWLLMAVGVLIIILATYVIIRMVGGDSSSTMEVDLDAPAVIVDGAVPNDTLVVGGAPAQPANVAPAPQPVPQPAAPAPVAKPAPKPQPAPAPARRASQQTQRAQTAPKTFAWYAQLGSYSTRALAESGQRQLRASHQNLFSGHQFVILAAVLNNGNTMYRLRVGFNTAADANNFCRNAKADGLECFVTK